MEQDSKTLVRIGSVKYPVRFSYLHAHTPKKKKDDNGNVVVDEDGKPVMMYSVQVRIDKRDTETKALCDAAIEAAADEYFGKKKPPASIMKKPFRDGDEEAEAKDDPTLKGCWFFNCSSKTKPSVVGPRKNPDTGKFDKLGEDQIKSGDYGKIAVNFFGFDSKSKGVAAGMGNIQFLRTGEALGSKRAAEDDFDDEEDGEDPNAADSNDSVL